jgi:hypothetical protein
MTAPDQRGSRLGAEYGLGRGEARSTKFAEITSEWFWELDENLLVLSVLGGRKTIRSEIWS